jgi:hypothetical protein
MLKCLILNINQVVQLGQLVYQITIGLLQLNPECTCHRWLILIQIVNELLQLETLLRKHHSQLALNTRRSHFLFLFLALPLLKPHFIRHISYDHDKFIIAVDLHFVFR